MDDLCVCTEWLWPRKQKRRGKITRVGGDGAGWRRTDLNTQRARVRKVYSQWVLLFFLIFICFNLIVSFICSWLISEMGFV